MLLVCSVVFFRLTISDGLSDNFAAAETSIILSPCDDARQAPRQRYDESFRVPRIADWWYRVRDYGGLFCCPAFDDFREQNPVQFRVLVPR